MVAQAKTCRELVDEERLEEAMDVLNRITDTLAQQNIGGQLGAAGMQRLADSLSLALSGATTARESSRQKLQRLRSATAAKAYYSATSLPP